MKESVTISITPKTDAENYPLLRETGISLLQAYSQSRWTDFNIHDPGVTILELLCYALTDLGYRTTFDIADLVTPDGGSAPDFENQFYKPHEIFPCHPVTITDYRRLILDVFPGIRNVWIKPENEDEIGVYEPNLFVNAISHELTIDALLAKQPASPLKLKGLYKVKLELENLEVVKAEYDKFKKLNWYTRNFLTGIEDVIENEAALKSRLKQIYTRGVLNLLMDHRNLCEDFLDISFSETEKVTVCADIDVSPTANLQQVWFKIYEILLNYIVPAIHFYSISDLLAKGKTIEEIFEGYLDPENDIDLAQFSPPAGSPPLVLSASKKITEEALLKKSFIDLDELENFNKRETILVSDLIGKIMDIPGIITVKSFMLGSYDDDGPIVFVPKNDFCLHLKDPEKSFEFILDYFLPIDRRQNKIVLYKGLIPYKIPPEGIGSVMSINYLNGQFEEKNNTELIMPSGSYRYLNDYFPVQNDFPPAYFIGKEGIPESASDLRKSQRLQLKSYLMFYEQILANFLAQTANITELLSWKSADAVTYFSQNINGIKDLDKLIDYAKIQIAEEEIKNKIGDPSEDSSVLEAKKYLSVFESPELAVLRKNRFLDHLLSRFNENFEELSLLKLSYSADAASSPQISVEDQKIIIGDKINFLRDYVKLSRDRSHALNYTTKYKSANTFWDTENISGIELRAGRKLGIDTVKRRTLLKTSGNCTDPSVNVNFDNYNFETDFGFHIVEHLLLRPRVHFETIVPVADRKDHFLNLCCCDNGGEETGEIHYCDDPYSLKLSIVFPGWDNYSPRWESYEQYIQFRKFVEQMIREEAPAHVALKICWISACQMEEFEKAYENYFKALSLSLDDNQSWNNDFEDINFYKGLKSLVKIINELKNHYKGGYLHDCELSEKDKRPFVLNSTVLGSSSE